MPFIDERGRVFGRLNLIDAAAVVLLALVVPLGIAAYFMFRAPTPTLGSVEPTTLQPRVPRQRIQIHGENLRPYLRVTFNGKKAERLLLIDFTSAEVVVPELEPGRYDVTLYDQARELGRIPNAITVLTPQFETKAMVRLIGIFRGLTSANAKALTKGRKLGEADKPPIGNILDVLPPQSDERWLTAGTSTVSIPVTAQFEVPASIRIECTFRERECLVGEVPVAPRAELRVPDASGSLAFYIEDVRPDRDPIDVDARVSFLTQPAVAQLVAVGDRHTAGVTFPASFSWLVSVSPPRTIPAQALNEVQRTVGAAVQRFGATLPDVVTKIDALVHLRVEESPGGGLRFHGEPVKVGAPLTFDTNKYVMYGIINSVQAITRSPSATPSTQ